MKKLFLTMLGVSAMLCSTSCSDEEIVASVEGEAMAQFTVELTDGSDASRAISDGLSVSELYYEVYSVKGDVATLMPELDKQVTLEKKNVDGKEVRTANVSLALVKGQAYNVVFWAQTPGAYNAEDLKNIAVNQKESANDETKDAFTAVYRTAKVTGPIKETIKLTRPFAQINFGTPATDIAAARNAGATIAQSEITVTYVATSYNALTEEGVGEKKSFTFELSDIKEAETLTVGEDNYKYLATAYVLFPGKADKPVTTDLTLRVPTGLNQDVVLTVPTAPAQRNFRTNVLGNLLTNQAEFNVVVDPIYNTPDNNPEVWMGDTEDVTENNGVYEIANGEQLAWVAEKANENHSFFAGKTIKLVDDIVLGVAWKSAYVWDNLEYTTTFDGNGHTIHCLTAPLFTHFRGTIKNLTIENATIESNGERIAAVVTNLAGNITDVTVKKSTITAVNANKDTKRWGGIVGLHMYGNATNCLVEDVTISGVTETAGGITGTVNETSNRTYTNCVVKNTTVEAGAEAGAIIGEIYVSGVKLVGCSQENTTPTNLVGNGEYADETNMVYNVNTLADLKSALNKVSANSIVNILSDIKGDATVTEKKDVKVVIDGFNNKYDGTISIYGNSADENAELVIKNVNFETSTFEEVFVYGFSTANGDLSRYPDAVTVENCTFTATGDAVHTAAAVKLASGRDDFKVLGCTATNMHSLAQFQSHDKAATVDGAVLNNCKNGVSFGTTAKAIISNSTINSNEYGVRGDGNGRNCELSVANTKINSKLPVVVRRLSDAKYKYSVALDDATVLSGAEKYDVVFTKGSDDVAPVAPVGAWSITGADNFAVYPRDNAVTTSEEFLTALADANIASIYLKAGSYEMGKFNASGREVSIKGESADKVTVTGSMHIVGGNKNFSLEGVTFEWDGTNNGVAVPIELKETSGLISFKNCVFSGANQKPTGNFGFINITNTIPYLNIEGCTFDKCAQRFGIWGHLAGNATTTSKITNNQFIGGTYNGGGICIEGPKTIQNIEINGNTITGYFRIVTSDSSYTLKNVAIEDNTLSQNLGYLNANTTIENVTFKNNKKANGTLWTSPNSKFITE